MTLSRTQFDGSPIPNDYYAIADDILSIYCFSRLSRLNPTVDRELLESAARLGAFRALETFDPTKGCSLRTYVFQQIHFEVGKAWRDMDYLPRSIRRQLSLNALDDIPPWFQRPVPFSQIHEESQPESESIIERIADEGPGPEEETITSIRRQELLQFIRLHFNIQEAGIIRLRYWQNWSQGDIARFLGKRQSTISDIERRVLRKLRRLLIDHHWTDAAGIWI